MIYNLSCYYSLLNRIYQILLTYHCNKQTKTDVGSHHFGVLPFLSYYKPSYAFRQDIEKTISYFLSSLDNKCITDTTYYTNKPEAKVVNNALASNVLIYFSIQKSYPALTYCQC